jgi:hypothetical protein
MSHRQHPETTEFLLTHDENDMYRRTMKAQTLGV